MRLLPLALASSLWVGMPNDSDRSESGVPSVYPTFTSGALEAPIDVTDTIFDVRDGDRLVFEGVSGELSIVGWDRDQIEIEGDDDEAGVSVRRRGSTLQIEPADRKGRRRGIEAVVRVPVWMDVEIRGHALELWLEELDGDVEVRNISGDINVDGVRGSVEVRTVEGEIEISEAVGGVVASSQSDDVWLRNVRGRIEAHSGSGDLSLLDVTSTFVQAETQAGDIDFSGAIDDEGSYRFFVHAGDADVSIPADSNARFSVSTFDGDFHSDFPVRLERFTGGRAFDFTLGSGGARVEIQVFAGEIRLLDRSR